MIINLSEFSRSARPVYDVGVKSYQAGQTSIELIGARIKIANDMTTQMPSAEKEIRADVIGFDRQGMDFFRRALQDITESFKNSYSGILKRPERHQSSISGYLRPLFKMNASCEYWDALREISVRENPIPSDYLIFLPEPDSKHPSRLDIVKALVPFKKSQQEAIISSFEDATTVIRITHGGVSAPQVILQ